MVLDGSSGLEVDTLTDAAASTDAPSGGAATGFGGMAPHLVPGQVQPWLATLGGGLLLIAFGIIGLRRTRRAAPTVRH